ncbi:VOC family protein [Streptomyces sp. NPDC004787]|uniref:VOC family protein n=1 Tax=Streptomyces sp. NPDC004787 TaxID=3154291 RepID=UPI0033BF7542
MNAKSYLKVPGATGVHHLGFTVPSLAEAVQFFTEILGAEVLYTSGPYSGKGGATLRRRLNVHSDSTVKLSMLRLGISLNIELFEYESPDQRCIYPRNSDWGGHHIAIWTDNFDASYEYLSSQPGMEALEGPNLVPGGPVAGTRWVYFKTPIGIYLELVSAPAEQPYEASTTARLYRPSIRTDR